jgi:hypothetical protein
MAKRGRPIGATSKLKNPVNLVAHYTSHLMELWLCGVPIQIGPDCRLRQPTRRRYTVPQTIQRTLCKLAIAHVVKLHQQTPEIQDSLRRGKAHAEAVFRRQGRDVLRRQGWTDEQIAAWYKKFQIASKRRMQREFRMPTVRAELVEFVDAVLAAVERKTPEYTARRKASERDYTQRTRRRKRIDVDKRLRRERGREADRDRKERARRAKGAKPRAQALSRTRPWDAEGISRRTWERRRAAAAAGVTQVRPVRL